MLKKWLALAVLGTAAAFVIPGIAIAAPEKTDVSGWTRLGGDPIVPGGVHSPAQVQKMLHSPAGETAMRVAGLSPAEANAVKNATFRSCFMRYGQWFQAMTYGIAGNKFDGPVQFLDRRYINNPAAAWCATVRVGNVVLRVMIPKICANFGLISRTRKPKTPICVCEKPPPPKVVPSIIKIAEDASGRQLRATPTNVFRFRVSCDGMTKVVIYRRTPQPVGLSCTVGTRIVFEELPVAGWILHNKIQRKQVFKARAGVVAVYKNRQVIGQPPPTVSFECTGILKTENPATRGVGVAVQFQAQNTRLLSTLIDWGDNTPLSVVHGTTQATHVYAAPGSWTISARIIFTAGTTTVSDRCLVKVAFPPPPPPVTPTCEQAGNCPPPPPPGCTTCPKTNPTDPGGGGSGNPSVGNPQPPSTPNTTSSASGPVSSDGSQSGGGLPPDPP